MEDHVVNGEMCLKLVPINVEGQIQEDAISTWPAIGETDAQAVVPAGDYYVMIRVGDPMGAFTSKIVLGKDGWTVAEKGTDSELASVGAPLHVSEGEVVDIPSDGLAEIAEKELAADLEKASES